MKLKVFSFLRNFPFGNVRLPRGSERDLYIQSYRPHGKSLVRLKSISCLAFRCVFNQRFSTASQVALIYICFVFQARAGGLREKRNKSHETSYMLRHSCVMRRKINIFIRRPPNGCRRLRHSTRILRPPAAMLTRVIWLPTLALLSAGLAIPEKRASM